jgi:branched-chain amino acid transport system ATP-binding protein
LMNAVRDAADSGTAVVLVEQFARLALDVADRAYVLLNGRVDTEGRAQELRGNLSEIESNYLGVDERHG